MKSFVNRVTRKISKLSSDQVEQLFEDVTSENELLESIFESLVTGLLIYNEDGYVLNYNRAFERLVPVKRPLELREDLSAWEYINDSEIVSFLQETEQNKKINATKDFTVLAASGKSREIRISTMSYVKNNKLAGTIIKAEDITEKRQQEILIKRMENLSSLTNLAANVAHEIKNPLGAISIHIQLIQKALKKARSQNGMLPDEKYVEKYLNIINEEIERLNTIVVDFLFAVRPVSVELEPVILKKFFEDLIVFIKPELEQNNIGIDFSIDETVPSAMIDTKLFKQVIINLVQNSIHALEKAIEKKIIISIKYHEQKIIISFADTGCGMDKETCSRIFEPYFTTKPAGTGLGLTMVYKIIQEFGGNIEVHSELNKGTVFLIELPGLQKDKFILEYKK
jgi:PAS domain S-box-containing protein